VTDQSKRYNVRIVTWRLRLAKDSSEHSDRAAAQHEPGYPKELVEMAGRVKATLQMLVGVYALGWLLWAFLLSPHMHSCAAISQHPTSASPQFCYDIPPARVAFQIIADALGAATVIQLVYTLFTPGPDEALDPVLLAIATALLFQLGSVESFHWQDGLAVLLYGAALGALFAVRIFIAPDEDEPPKLWWWFPRYPYKASSVSSRTGPTDVSNGESQSEV
jgi:hypothetical protein